MTLLPYCLQYKNQVKMNNHNMITLAIEFNFHESFMNSFIDFRTWFTRRISKTRWSCRGQIWVCKFGLTIDRAWSSQEETGNVYFLFVWIPQYVFVSIFIEKYSQMKSIKLQAEWVYHYESEVQNIHVELQSLKDIALSLPRKCWNTIRLEP